MKSYGDAFNSAVAAELRAERSRVKMTFDTLVAKTGISKSAVMNYLNDKREIPTPAFVELCSALGISPRVIFERAENAMQED